MIREPIYKFQRVAHTATFLICVIMLHTQLRPKSVNSHSSVQVKIKPEIHLLNPPASSPAYLFQTFGNGRTMGSGGMESVKRSEA